MTKLAGITARDAATQEETQWLVEVVQQLAGTLRILEAYFDDIDDNTDPDDRRVYYAARKRTDGALAFLSTPDEVPHGE